MHRYGWRAAVKRLFVGILLSLVSGCPVHAAAIPAKYDFQFRKWSSVYMPMVDYRLLKAQCWQESRFVVNAVSPVGAMGLCQFMPGTWKDTKQALGYPSYASAFAPDLSIQAAAFYMGKMRSIWKAPRPETDRHSFALASYNGGAGNMIKAQKLANNSPLWPPVAAELHRVTGHNSKETITYVERIWGFYRSLVISG